MVTEYLLSLPAWLVLKETPTNPQTQFNLHIFKNHSREMRLCYQTNNQQEIVIPWNKEGPRDWIFLMEGISDDACFVEAAQYVLHELQAKAQYFENPFKFKTTKA